MGRRRGANRGRRNQAGDCESPNQGHVDRQDDRRFEGTRSFSRTRLGSENNGEVHGHQSEIHIPSNFAGTRTSSHISIRSNCNPKDDNNHDGQDEHISIRGSRCSSRSRQISVNKDRDEDHHNEVIIPTNFTRSRASSRASIRSNYNPEQDNLNGQEEHVSGGGSRCSSRSHLLSENVDRGDSHYSEINIPFAGSRAASLINIPSNSDMENGCKSNLQDKRSVYGSRCSSRSRQLSESNDHHSQVNVPYHLDGSRASSHISIHSNYNPEEYDILDCQGEHISIRTSRCSSRSRQLSENRTQDDHHSENNMKFNFAGSRASSRLSIHSNYNPEEDKILDDQGENIYIRTSRCSSRSRQLSENETQDDHNSEINIPSNFTSSRVSSRNGQLDNIGIGGGRYSPRVRLLSENVGRSSNDHSENSLPFAGSRAASLINIRTNDAIKIEGHSNLRDEVASGRSRCSSRSKQGSNSGLGEENNYNAQDERQSLSGSRFSSRTDFSITKNGQAESQRSGFDIPSIAGSQTSSQLSVQSNCSVDNPNRFSQQDQQSAAGSRCSSRSRLLSESNVSGNEMYGSEVNIPSNVPSPRASSHSRASSHLSIHPDNGLPGEINSGAQDECLSESRFYSCADFLTANSERSESRQGDINENSNFNSSRATSSASCASNHGMVTENNFIAPDELPSLGRSRSSFKATLPSENIVTDGRQCSDCTTPSDFANSKTASLADIHPNYVVENEGSFSQQSGSDIAGSRHSSRSRLPSDNNSQYEGHNNGNIAPSNFAGSRASSHVSSGSHYGQRHADDFHTQSDQRSHGGSRFSSRNRLVSDDSWQAESNHSNMSHTKGRVPRGSIQNLGSDSASALSMDGRSHRSSISGNVSGMGYNETDEHLHLAQVNSHKESNLNLEHRKHNSSDQCAISSKGLEYTNAASLSRNVSESRDGISVPLCSTNAMTPSSIHSRLAMGYAESPSVFEKTQVEVVSHFTPRVCSEMAVQTGETIRLRQAEVPIKCISSFENNKLASSIHEDITPATPKSSRYSVARIEPSANPQRFTMNYNCDTNTSDRLLDDTHGSASKWNIKDPRNLDRSRSGHTDAKWEQKFRDPGRTVRNNVKPGMIRHLAALFDQKEVQSIKEEKVLKHSVDCKAREDVPYRAISGNPTNLTRTRKIFGEQCDQIPTSCPGAAGYRRTAPVAYNGIQDAYINVSQDSSDSYFRGSTSKNNDADERYSLRGRSGQYSQLEKNFADHCETSGHNDYVRNISSKVNESVSSDIKQIQTFGSHTRKPSSCNSLENFEHIKISDDGREHHMSYQGFAESSPASSAHSNRNNGKPLLHGQKSRSNCDNSRSSSLLGQEVSVEDIIDNNFNVHIDHLFGFVKSHDSQSNDLRLPSNRDDQSDRGYPSRSVSQYRDMQRSKRVVRGDGPIRFTPTRVPNPGYLAQNSSGYKKALSAEDRMIALATSTPRDSPHVTMIDANSNYDDSFLSSITDGSRGEKYPDHRQQINIMNKLNRALDSAVTQIEMTERILMQARKERKPLQELAAQRTLLVSKERVKLVQKEMRAIQELANIRRHPSLSRDVRGSMLISDIIVHLNPRFYNERNADNNCSYAFIVLLKCGYEVEATSPVTVQSQSQFRLRQLHFFEKISFGNLPMSFEVQLEVFCMVIPDNKYNVSCTANLADKCRSMFTPARKYDRNVDGMSVGEFSSCGYLLLSRDTTSRTTFYLDSAEYPLESTIEVRSRCSNLPPSIEVDFRGSLSMCQYVSGVGSWERYWAVLRRGCIYFWRYADKESIEGDPAAELDLTSTIRDTITPCGPDQCTRPYSFSIDVLVPTAPSIMDRKRVLLSADSDELMESWLDAINETLSIIRGL